MILAMADQTAVVIGDPMASSSQPRRKYFCTDVQPEESVTAPRVAPLTGPEIEEYSRIKCCVCGERVLPDDVMEHSKICVLEPAPNLRLQLDKWCIASASMTIAEQRTFLHMRRTEELARVESIEADLLKMLTSLWWMGGSFGYIVSSKWFREWRSFVGAGDPCPTTKNRPPSPINNMDLFELDGSVRADMHEGVENDFVKMALPIWDLFFQLYGGGPVILRYNPSGTRPSPADEPAKFEGNWRDFRPDTGSGLVFDSKTGCGFDGEIRGGFLWNCSGKGLMRNGSHFEGNVVNGLPSGQGREVRPDGTVFEGNFLEGKLHGFGVVKDPCGRLANGEWENGVLRGI